MLYYDEGSKGLHVALQRTKVSDFTIRTPKNTGVNLRIQNLTLRVSLGISFSQVILIFPKENELISLGY
jgi:hypothetical protein